MKNICTILILVSLLFSKETITAKPKPVDVIYFKNGNIIRGSITAVFPDSIVKIISIENDKLKFNMCDIDRIDFAQKVKTATDPFEIRSKKLSQSFDVGFLVARNNYYYYGGQLSYYFTISMVSRYHILSFLTVGAGIGVDEYVSDPLVPLFGEIRCAKGKGRLSPYFYLQGGYGFTWLNKSDQIDSYGYEYDYKGGNMVSGGLGIKYYANADLAFTFSVGYKNQKAQTVTDYGESSLVTDYTYSRVTYKIGVTF